MKMKDGTHLNSVLQNARRNRVIQRGRKTVALLRAGLVRKLAGKNLGGSLSFHNYTFTQVPPKVLIKFPNSINTNLAYTKPGTFPYVLNHARLGINHRFVYIMSNELVIAFAEIYVSTAKTRIELYNLYTHPDYRRRGHALKLLNNIKEKYRLADIWLGVDPRNLAAINVYLIAGFVSLIKYTNTSAFFGSQFDFYFIQMVYKRSKPEPTNEVKLKAMEKIKGKISYNRIIRREGNTNPMRTLRNNPTINRGNFEVIKARFKLTSAYMRGIRTFINKKYSYQEREVAGVGHMKYIKSTKTYETIADTRPKISNGPKFVFGKGGGIGNFTVLVPTITEDNVRSNYLFCFHTHPLVCYKIYGGVCLGLPSSTDIMIYLERFLLKQNVPAFDLVFAPEAVYICSFKRTFIAYVLSRSPQELLLLQTTFQQHKQEYTHLIDEVGAKRGSLAEMTAFPEQIQRNQFRTGIWNIYKQRLESLELQGHRIFNIQKKSYMSSGFFKDVVFEAPLLLRHHKMKNPNLKV